MTSGTLPGLWERIDRAERGLCLRANRTCHRRIVRSCFAVVSRLGDGVFWYALMAAIALAHKPAGPPTALRMAIAGLCATGLYRVLKRHCVRERPYVAHPGIVCGTAPLDRYSFPSGHTLHAVNFTLLACVFEPWLVVVLAPFAMLVAPRAWCWAALPERRRRRRAARCGHRGCEHAALADLIRRP
jgi:undecaprenyl-diphosphatase